MLHLYILISDHKELCLNIDYDHNLINSDFIKTLFHEIIQKKITNKPTLKNYIEIGPKLNYKTPWCSNVLQLFVNNNIEGINRIEQSFLYSNRTDYNYDLLTEDIYSKPLNTFHHNDINKYQLEEFSIINKCNEYNIDNEIYNYYCKIFKNQKINNIELFDLAQSNSEHARHWFFSGNINILNNDKLIKNLNLFKLVKSTNKFNSNSIVAFKDNASAILGFKVPIFIRNKTNKYRLLQNILHLTHNAETHNFPTGICPFWGASTGTGGRIRDTISIGKGGGFISGLVGYSVGEINSDWEYPHKNPIDLIIDASNGCSDYGNKIGEPVTLGFTRSFGMYINKHRIEYVKPILYSASNGYIYHQNIQKDEPKFGDLLVRVGGPAYSVGLGGGAASSKSQNDNNINSDLKAVQRGDPEMENKMYKFVKRCFEMIDENPILSIHDQGSGGMANVTKEIISPKGALVSIDNVKKGQLNISPFEIWNAEYQEQCSFLIKPYTNQINLIKSIAKRENVNLEFVGVISNSNKIQVNSKNHKKLIVDLELEKVLENVPTKTYKINLFKQDSINFFTEFKLQQDNFKNNIEKILKDLNVCSKKFLTNKVDRSVTGLIAQQQCVGPFQLPLSNFSLNALSIFDLKGIASSIGEQPLKGIVNIKSMIDMTIIEALSNLIFVKINSLESIKVLTNWMWSINIKNNDYLLVEAAEYLVSILNILNIGIDGGKDSLFMNCKYNNETIQSPNTLVLKTIAPVKNINKKITPYFKKNNSNILLIHNNKYRLGGSIFYKTLNKLASYKQHPRFENPYNFKNLWNIIQKFISNNMILSGHDRSDGGLITTLIEMSISSYYGCNININSDVTKEEYLFNEEFGIVLEVEDQFTNNIIDRLRYYDFNVEIIGKTTKKPDFNLNFNNEVIFSESNRKLLKDWEYTSYKLELKQCNNICVEKEYNSIDNFKPYKYFINEYCSNKLLTSSICKSSYKVAIIRTNGSNGESEMCSAFYNSGFEVFDVTMTDIMESQGKLLNNFNGLAFVGGFSYSDVLGSSKAWAFQINYNSNIKNNFDNFYNSKNKFVLGVCNGCQLLSNLGWLPKYKIIKNDSERFESRYVKLKVSKNNSIFTKNMENTIFGMWSAHGEGKILRNDIENFNDSEIAFSYLDLDNNPTEEYPYNPNGSEKGIAGLSSNNGRCLGIMPHPERSIKSWQLPYITPNITYNIDTPWSILFKNALEFCKIKDLN